MPELNNIVNFPNNYDNQKTDEMDYQLYVLAELTYRKTFPGVSEESLYPDDWYSRTDYKTKNEIIAQAIQNKTLIKDTPLYQELIQDIL